MPKNFFSKTQVYVNWFAESAFHGFISFMQAILPSIFVALIATPVVYFLLEKKGIIFDQKNTINNMSDDLYFDINNNIKEISDSIKIVLNKQRIVGTRQDNYFPPFEKMIENSENEICLSGLTFDVTAAITPLLQKKAKIGIKIKLLFIDIYNENLLNEFVDYFRPDEDKMYLFKRIDANLTRLYTDLVCKYPSNVEIKISPYRPGFGFFIVDPESDNAKMTVTGYLYKAKALWSPVLFIEKHAEGQLYKKFYDGFNGLWDDAKEWKPRNE